MKRKLILMGIAMILVTATAVGGTLAAMTYSDNAEAKTSKITTGNLEIAIEKNRNEEQVLETYSETLPSVLPGEQVLLNRKVTNTGDYSAYIRVIINKSWNETETAETETGETEMQNLSEVFRSSVSIPGIVNEGGVYLIRNGAKTGDTTEGMTISNRWIVFSENKEQLVLYYSDPVAVGESTDNFINAISFDPDLDNTYADKEVTLEYTVDAVQQIAADESITAAWGVFPTFSGTTITAISETP